MHRPAMDTLNPYRNAPLSAAVRALCSAMTRPLREVLSRVPAGTSVLDYGAGDGQLAAWLAARGRTVVAVEPDPRRIELGAALHRGLPNLCFVRDLRAADARGPFDVVLVVDVLYLVPRAERAGLARRLAALMAPSGRAVLKEVVASGIVRDTIVGVQERLVGLLTGCPPPVVDLPERRELDSLALVFGTIRESVDLPVAWYAHRLVVAGGTGGGRG
ncbi:MAG: methyltransferase domain-containing protein [Deltaproteobacteria bacterium]|nr:methyltransferase domain-containing protein [Deltaproteobacteria bacterium]